MLTSQDIQVLRTVELVWFISYGGFGICSDYMIFRIIGPLAISAQCRKKIVKKGEIIKN